MLDDEDYEKVTTIGKTPKWCVRIPPDRNGLVYFQKRLSDYSLIEMHRFIMGFPRGKYVDHINGNTLDNRKSNLRVCSNAANLRNGKLRPNNTTGKTGVSFYPQYNESKPWFARIRVGYKTINLGSYQSFEDAVRKRKEAETKYWED